MSGILHEGARFALKRLALAADSVRYQGIIELPPGDRGFVQILDVAREDATFEASPFTVFGDVAGTPEQWMVDSLGTLMKQALSAGLKRDAWPRKLRRWKAPPK